MSINPDQVVLLESQRLTDEDDGGGRATGIVIQDGQINNMFQDISRLNRTLGDVSLRKFFVGIDTDNADLYLGAHAIIVQPPADPNVSVVLFEGTESDERRDAQNRIEAYVVQGARAQFELLGNQYENQRQLVVIQREQQTLPATGDVYVMRNTSGDEQYVRVTEVDHEIQTFTYQSGQSFIDFQRRRVVLGISAPLNFTFIGGEPTPVGTSATNSQGVLKAEVFDTEVADAARFWGVMRSNSAASVGDLSIFVPSIYANLVPSAQSEQPLSDQPLGYPVRTTRPAANADYSTTLTAQYLTGVTLAVFLPRPAVRGTVQLTLGGSVYTDDGSGVLTRSSGSHPFATLEIDYETGSIQGVRDSGTSSGTVAGSVTFRPGVVFTGRAETYNYPITLNNQSYNYVRTYAETKPRPGTMIISYMVGGKWYEIRDPGNGVLEGQGSGSVNFITGTVTITLRALPDPGSALIVAFLMDIEEELEQHNQMLASAIPDVVLQLLEGVNPLSVSIDYTVGGVTQTLTDNGSGLLIGDGSGSIDYASGLVIITPAAVHDDGTDFAVSYSASDPETVAGPAVVGDEISGTIPNAPLLPGSITVSAFAQRKSSAVGPNPIFPVRIRDDTAGGWIGYAGSINYTTGAYTLTIARGYTTTHEKVNYAYEFV